MPTELTTHRDARRYTVRRVVMAAALSVALTVAMTIVTFGTDPSALAPVGRVMISMNSATGY